jgi:hypothetical protein
MSLLFTSIMLIIFTLCDLHHKIVTEQRLFLIIFVTKQGVVLVSYLV